VLGEDITLSSKKDRIGQGPGGGAITGEKRRVVFKGFKEGCEEKDRGN